MNFLPKDIENIILSYKNQLENTEKMNKSLEKIKNISYEYDNKNIIISNINLENKKSYYILNNKKLYFGNIKNNNINKNHSSMTLFKLE